MKEKIYIVRKRIRDLLWSLDGKPGKGNLNKGTKLLRFGGNDEKGVYSEYHDPPRHARAVGKLWFVPDKQTKHVQVEEPDFDRNQKIEKLKRKQRALMNELVQLRICVSDIKKDIRNINETIMNLTKENEE